MSTRHARGNTTFLVVLAVIVCAVFVGVAAVGLKQARKSPQKLVALGDQQAQQNDYEKAVQYYSKAVNKDQTNPEWLERWVGAMEKTTPDSRDAYTERYAREYRPALLALAKAKGDGASYRRFLEETLQTLRAGDLKNLEGFVSLTDDLIKELPAEAPAVPTIRRFRGMGKVAMITPGVAPSAQEREQVEADLAAALAADPGDEEALVTLASLHRRLAAQHRQDRQDEAAQRELAAARKLLTDFAASHPHSPLALAELAALEMESARGTAARGAVTALPPEVSARVIEAVAAAPPEKLKPGVVAAAAGLARMLPEGGAERALEVYEAALAKRPGDAQIEFARASQLHSMGRSDEAAAAFKALAARPDLPLSLEGLNLFGLRELAALRHFDAVLAGWRPDLEPAGRAELLTRARAVRADLVGRVKDSAPVVTLIDAKLAYLEGEYAEATRLLSKYHKDTAGGDASSLLLLGEVQLRQGNTGAAREQFREAAKRSPSDVRAHLAVAGTELSMNDAEAARASYARVVELDPGNTEAAQKLALLDELSKGAQSSDVFVRAQSEVNQLLTRDPPDTAGALAKATAARDAHPDDARLAILLARLQVGSKDRPAARATLEQALARHPDHAGLKQMLAAVQGDDPTQAALAAVEQSGEPELIKHLQRYDIYGRAQRPDEALRELRAAEKLGPEHPAVVDALLHHAVGANDKAEVARLAQLGESKNLDKVGGVTYRARLAAFEQRYADALAMLRQAIEQDPMNPALHRFMGDVASRTGDHELAARSFREAVRARPSDPTSVRGLVGSLAALGRLDEALQAAREAQRTLGGDPEVQRLRLTLEEQAPGGDKALALSVRRRMAQSNPDDVPNRVSLAALAIRQGERELATRLVAELEGKADAAVMAELRATLAAAGGDVEGAKRVMQEHIASLPAERRTITPYFVLARVLEQAGRPEEALAAMEPARELQDPATRPVDQEMGALAFRARRYPEALTAFTRALEGVEKDPDNRLLKAVVQTQLLLGRFEEAERTVAQLGPAAEGDHQLAMLRGDAAAGRGDPERARRLYDDAAKLAPRDPMVFVRRAEFLMRQPDPGSLRDAQEDLRAALRLDPAFEPARRLLVDSLVAGGQFDVAVQELRKLLVDHPENGDVRAQLLTVLALRGRTDDLIGELRAAVQREPESVRWLTSLGSTLVRAGRAREAVPHLAKAWEVESSPLIAGVYVTGLLALSPPDHARALEVLASEKIATEKDPGLLLFRAHALATAGRAAEARADVVRAYSMVPADDPSSVQGFFAGLAAIAPKPADVLALMEQIKPAGGHPGWFDYWLAMGLQGDPATRGRALEMLGAIAEGPDQVKAFAAHRVLGALAYQDKRHEEAVAHFRKALEARPGDPEVSNNLAYALAVDLHKPEEALQHAERAAALMRTNASVLDTLGVVYLELGRTDEAAGTFMRGLSMAVTPQEKASLYYGMARAKLRAGDRVEAKRYADQLEAQVKTTPGLLTTFESRLGSLRADLSGQ